MKKLYPLFIALLITAFSFGQTTVFQESFETGNSGTPSETCNDNGSDFFTRTDGSDITTAYQVSGMDGTFFFAAQDTDGTPCTSAIQTLTFTGINISSFTNLSLVILAAEDDSSDGLEDWDANSSVVFAVNIDGGGYTNVIQFSGGGATNTEPGLDTDFNGIADGTALTPVFQEFAAAIGSGTSADIQITFNNLDAGDEDIAIDNIRLVDGFVADPTLTLVGGPASGGTVDLGPEDLTGDLEFATTNFTVGEPGTPSQADGYIVWSIDVQGGGNHDSGVVYDTSLTYPFLDLSPNVTYLFTSELLDNSGASLVPPITYNLTINTLGYNVVTDIGALRADVTANGTGLYYEITGAVLVTHTDGFNNRHWIQDSNISGILIFDPSDIIAPAYGVGDSVTGLKGSTEEVNGVLRFNPSTNSGIATPGSTVTPQVVDILTYTGNYEDYESELIELQNVSFLEGDGIATFGTGANYTVSDGVNTVVKRTDFFGADYIGTIIPSTPLSSLVAVTGEFFGTPQIYVRSLADITLGIEFFETTEFSMYPNPNKNGILNINSSAASLDVEIFDVLGKKVISETQMNGSLDVSSLQSGLYLVSLTSGNQTVTKKLIIE